MSRHSYWRHAFSEISVPQVSMVGLSTLARPASTNGDTPSLAATNSGTPYPAIVTGGSSFPSVSMVAPTYRRDPPYNLF